MAALNKSFKFKEMPPPQESLDPLPSWNDSDDDEQPCSEPEEQPVFKTAIASFMQGVIMNIDLKDKIIQASLGLPHDFESEESLEFK